LVNLFLNVKIGGLIYFLMILGDIFRSFVFLCGAWLLVVWGLLVVFEGKRHGFKGKWFWFLV
jgi:hypothetical protein